MVGVAQLVEPRVVIPVVAGSSPVAHPRFLMNGPLAQLVEQETLNLLVEGSTPSRPTIPQFRTKSSDARRDPVIFTIEFVTFPPCLPFGCAPLRRVLTAKDRHLRNTATGRQESSCRLFII